MLTQMRKNAGSWIIKLLLGAVVVVFIFWGVGPEQKGANQVVATVDGEPIGYAEFSQTYRNLMENIRRQFGGSLTEEMMSALNLKEQAVNQLVDRRIILNQARQMGFKISDEELAMSIRSIPGFQLGNGFDTQTYQRVLNRMGMTPEYFEAMQREELLIQKVNDFLTRSVNVSDEEATSWHQWQNTAVDIEYLRVDPLGFKDISVNEEDSRRYFEANKQRYKTAPKIRARYVVFRPSDYKAKVTVDENEVKTYYDENQAEFFAPETVEARHILIQVNKDADEKTVETGRLKAEDILARAQKGEDFAELAKELSEGPSKNQGGYLGTFERGRMVKPFEEAAFSLKDGEISEPVRTDFGWHIIKVEKHTPAETRTLEASQNKIRGQLSEQKARALALEDAESAYDMSYGDDDLLLAAERLNVSVETTGMVARDQEIPGVKNTAKFMETAFGMEDMAVSDVQDLGDGFYIIQTLEHLPSQVPNFEEVKSRVDQDVVKDKQWEQAEVMADAILQSLKEGATMAEVGQTRGLSPQQTGWFKRNDPVPGFGMDPQLAVAAFKLSPEEPLPEKPLRGEKGVSVIRHAGRQVPDSQSFGDADLEATKQQLRQRKQQETFGAWMSEARSQSEIEIDPAAIK